MEKFRIFCSGGGRRFPPIKNFRDTKYPFEMCKTVYIMKLLINPDQNINFISLLQVVSSFGEHLKKKFRRFLPNLGIFRTLKKVVFTDMGKNCLSHTSHKGSPKVPINLYFSETFLLEFFKKAGGNILFAMLPFSQGCVRFLFSLWVKSESE